MLGFLAGTLAGHIAWALLLVRMLRPLGRGGRAGIVIVVTPVLVIALGLLLAGYFPLIAIVLCGIPAALTWWAAEPRAVDP